ncbi:hypothetical protein [Arcticibacterium luteifluviistationis]|uniref:Porin n=1 Tax=Arcticibacterium luteifluviistationis TaxID=1784714 RepID=A0A2Z4G6K8_9BACT|nr:hypothetical protein [Arcticibacterium luteifluviistationis]AWV96786.1 hypothetical protein DJ013_00705 [Arcticibacterium luteifluviistationis]
MRIIILLIFSTLSISLKAQQPQLQFFRANDKHGLNVFETSKKDTVIFEGIKVRVGGDFAMQFQSIDQSNKIGNLVELGSNLNLPSANLNIDVQLIDGVRMHLRTYLSSQHHEDSWVKGGHLQIDKLDFIKPGFLEEIMKIATITVGLDEFNYGDAHFRRSDNARAIFNPFVGNYIMDAFSTEAFGEVTLQENGFLGVVGITNGKLNQNVVVNDNTDNKLSLYGKLGYDNQLNDDLRVRLTGSVYTNQGTSTGAWLYGGDRTGARYYNVLHTLPDADGITQGGAFEGRYNSRFVKLTAVQINPFIKYKGLEFFGVYELASGNNEIKSTVPDKEGAFTQLAAELVYRFGNNERFYLAGRYNTVQGKALEGNAEDLKISRVNVGGGWFLSKNIVTKIEYVNQQYTGEAWAGRFSEAKFDGINIEAAISF